jgi:hypothetical protein
MPSNSLAFESIFFLVVIILLVFQLRRRRVRFFGLVILPLIMLLFTLPIIMPDVSTSLLGIVLIALGLVIGAGIGIAIGSMMKVEVDEKDGSMVLKGSILAVALWAGIIGLKIFGKDLINSIGIIDMSLVTSMFLMMAVASMITRRGYVYWRYLQMKNAPTIQVNP